MLIGGAGKENSDQYETAHTPPRYIMPEKQK
jgi:hypothetical protein